MNPSPIDPASDPDFIDCPFCRRISVGRLIIEDSLGVVFRDSSAVSPGHLHIAPRRHEDNFFALSHFERDTLWDILWQCRAWLEEEHSPAGYNIGVNIGSAAGQTVPHANIHMIPRYDKDGRGSGIRQILGSERARYRRQKGSDKNFLADIESGNFIHSNALALAIPGAYPITPGHIHVVPRRVESDFFRLKSEERDSIWDIIDQLVDDCEESENPPDGYNLGINIGSAAGQTMEHANVHFIPRWQGDSTKQGGMRLVVDGSGRDFDEKL